MGRVTRREIAELLLRFLDGPIGDHEWDDFISVRFKEPEIEAIRIKALEIEVNYPAEKATITGRRAWCS